MPREMRATGRTVKGEMFTLKRASIIVGVPKAGLRMEGYAETFEGNLENLIELSFLESLKMVLNGPEKGTLVQL